MLYRSTATSGPFDMANRAHLNDPEPTGLVTCDCNIVQVPRRTSSNKNGNEGRWYYACNDCKAYSFADELHAYPNVDGASIHGKRHQERTEAARQHGARAAAEMNYGASQAAAPAAAPHTPVQAPPPAAAAAAAGTPVRSSVVQMEPAADGRPQQGLQVTVPIPAGASTSLNVLQAAADAAYHAAQQVLAASAASTAAAGSGLSNSRPQHPGQLPVYTEPMGTPGGSNPGFDRQGMAPPVQRHLDFSSSPAGLLSQGSGSGGGGGSQLPHTPNSMGSQQQQQQQQLPSQGSQSGLVPTPGVSAQQVLQQQRQHAQLVRVRVAVFNDPEDPQGLLLFTGDYNDAVKLIMNVHKAQWYKPIKRWKIYRDQYSQLKQELAQIGYDMADEPQESAAEGA